MTKEQKLVKALRSLVLSVTAHPDYTGEENAEWTDLIEIAEEALSSYAGPAEPSKKKISRFEYVFMQAADPEKAKEFEPYTEQEEMDARVHNLQAQASRLLIQAASAEGEKERSCNPTPDSDALMEPPSFEQMVGLIKKNFRDVLELPGIEDEDSIAKAWERYKCLNHLYLDREPEKKDPWISVNEQLPNDGQEVSIWIEGADWPIQAYCSIDVGILKWYADSEWKNYTKSDHPTFTQIESFFDVTHWAPLLERPKDLHNTGGKS